MQRLKAVKSSGNIAAVISPGHETFAMLEKQALYELDALMKKDVHAARILMALVRHLESGSDGVVVVSNKGLQQMLDMSESTVARALRQLIAGNWVQRMKVGGAHALAVNKAVAWVGPRGNMDKAVFSATVIAVRSEQDEKALATTKLKQVPMTHEGEHVIAIGDEPDPPAQHLLEGLEPVTATKKAPAKHWRGKKKPELLKS